MCLIARYFEEQGLPTLILGSALDIITAGNPPRGKFVNYPLGFESGRVNNKADQLSVVREALSGFDHMTKSGVDPLDHEWTDGWDMVNKREEGVLDNRSPRNDEPQYQNEADRIAAER